MTKEVAEPKVSQAPRKHSQEFKLGVIKRLEAGESLAVVAIDIIHFCQKILTEPHTVLRFLTAASDQVRMGFHPLMPGNEWFEDRH